MNRSSEQAFSKESFLAAAEQLASKRKSGLATKAALRPFLEQYLADAFIEDFLALTTEDAAALALDLFEFNAANETNAARAISSAAFSAVSSKAKSGSPALT